ncbi:MAG: helix-turn-helix domain-containing protein [Pseudomonadota bacterium]
MNTLETLDVAEVAALLRAESETIMQLARKGELPGTRIGKSWVFLREDVILFLKNQIAKDTDQRRRQRASISHTAVSVDPPVKNRRKSLPVLPTVPGLVPHNPHQR